MLDTSWGRQTELWKKNWYDPFIYLNPLFRRYTSLSLRHLYANHVLHPQHTAGKLSQKDLDKQRITRLQRPFKGSSTDGIIKQAIGYRPWTWSMLKLSIHSHIMYKNITKTWIIFIFIGDLWSYLNISLVPKAKKEKIAKFPSRGLEKYGNIKRKTSLQWHVPLVCCGWRRWLAYPITPWEACLTSK